MSFKDTLADWMDTVKRATQVLPPKESKPVKCHVQVYRAASACPYGTPRVKPFTGGIEGLPETCYETVCSLSGERLLERHHYWRDPNIQSTLFKRTCAGSKARIDEKEGS